jgi:hypothetical protein
MVGEHRADYGSMEAMTSIASKIRHPARRCAAGADDKARLKLLEREVKNCGARQRDSTARLRHILRRRSLSYENSGS